ncbi:hypothetical protein DEFDS_0445 [Deferribacter desulfuricans SSM1]|uniref:GerMN domain-containing protein n=1 Tax=Deferribacter desulfuricans (strain DSM 14783 / JCM 11476 / NBRC 101012 / SSM1) TaxID=639282 RepID=D3PBG6_DEFDS|nr:GerMN domain-containing protein [Deferribacter desulfuricans]BAI79939.1 hypothetical protein DEFDS_0445 [Deferribacter desulfuricans SSM1]
MRNYFFVIIGLAVIVIFFSSIKRYDVFYIDTVSNELVPKKVIVINPFYRKDVYAYLLLNKLKIDKGNQISPVGKYVSFENVRIKNDYCVVDLRIHKGFVNSSNNEYLLVKSILKTLKSFDNSIKLFKINILSSDVELQMDYNCAMTIENDEIKIVEGSCNEK